MKWNEIKWASNFWRSMHYFVHVCLSKIFCVLLWPCVTLGKYPVIPHFREYGTFQEGTYSFRNPNKCFTIPSAHSISLGSIFCRRPKLASLVYDIPMILKKTFAFSRNVKKEQKKIWAHCGSKAALKISWGADWYILVYKHSSSQEGS